MTPARAAMTPASADPPASSPTTEAAIAVSGSVSGRLVSAQGPTTAGVFAGHSVAALLHGMRRAGHGMLSCPPGGCWQGRQLPPHWIGVAFQANPLGCDQVDSVRVSMARWRGLRLAVQAHPVCTHGGGAAAKGRTILIALPLDALPHAGTLTVHVDLAMSPGDMFKSLGSARTSL